jgi:hypothetical protein
MKTLIFLFILISVICYDIYSQGDDTTEVKRFQIIIDPNGNPVVKPYQPDTVDANYKVAGYTFYDPHSPVTLEHDSLYFDGYLIFEAHRFEDDKFHDYDWTYYQFEIFILDSLNKIKDNSKRFYFNPIYLDYYYADDKEIGYDTGTGRNKDHGEVILTEDLKEPFIKFKAFYTNYLFVRNIYDDKYFLMGTLRTKIFEDPKAIFWKYDSDSISYFVYKCRFYTAILKYDAYYLTKDDRVYLKDLHFFLPVSKSFVFEPAEEDIMLKAGFIKSIWYPPNLFLKEQKK